MNLNDEVYVRLTTHGLTQWASYWMNTSAEGVPKTIVEESTELDGRIRFQLWELMNIFGQSCYNGSSELPFENNLIETK